MDFKAHRDVLKAFLDEARQSGITDLATHGELVEFLDVRTGQPVEPEPVPKVGEQLAEPPAPSPTPVRTPPILPQSRRPVVRPQTGPQPRPVTPPLRPPEPGQLAKRWPVIREAVVSDLSLHGFAYLGVLVISACVLGLLLFAFADIPDAHQPFYELVIALIFFGFAWYLRRQHAVYVARAMELVGGIALPLVLFAGMVDGAPIPPDFRETPLVIALAVTALILSIGYALRAARNDDSILGHLVAPLWWLAALTVGFVFKTDEPLTGDAITRLVSHQPAMAATAVGLTVVWMTYRPAARLTAPSRTAAYVGAPVAYLLTISLAAGEGWAHTIPLLLAGAATFLSTELLVRHLGKAERLVTRRPFLAAALIAPLLPALDNGVSGILVVAAYIAMFEWTARTTPSETTALTLSRAGIGLGAAMTLGEAWPTLVVFTAISVWAHYRRARPVVEERDLVNTLAAAIAPVGVGYALTMIIPGSSSWAVMAAILITVAAGARFAAGDDDFWVMWPSGAALLVSAGVLSSATVTTPDPWRIATLTGVAGTIAMAPRWRTARLWASSAIMVMAVGEAAGYLPNPVIGKSFTFAILGLALVTFAALRPRPYSGHLAAIGHVLAAMSWSATHTAGSMAVVSGIWTIGWVITTLACERDSESLTTLLLRVLGEPGRIVAELTAPLIAAASIPVAAHLALRLWPAYATDVSWFGVTLAILSVSYSLVARALTGRTLQTRIAAWGALVLMALAPLPATPHRIPLMVALAAGVTVAVTLRRTLKSRLLTGYGWASCYVLVVLVVEQSGVATDHLDAVALVLGLAGVVASLLADDVLAGRRDPGEGVRLPWLGQPMLLGAVAAGIGLVSLLFELPDSGWWVFAAGIATVGVSYLARIGLLSGPGYLLAAVGVVTVDLDFWLSEAWRGAILAGPLVVIAITAHWRQSEKMAHNDLLRWDLPALMVAHLIGGIALLAALVGGGVMLTALVFGGLSLALGAAYRSPVWLEAGNGLFVLAAFDAGTGWLALILGITSVRGAVGAYLSRGATRRAQHLLGAISGVVGWLVFLSWLEVNLSEAIELSALIASGFTLFVAAAGRLGRIRSDSVRIWGGAGVALVVWSAWGSVAVAGIDGPELSIGALGVAVAMDLSHRETHRGARFVAVPTTGLAWMFLLVGSGLSPAMATGSTALIFGLAGVVIAELTRRTRSDGASRLATAWGALAFLAVAVATMNAWLLGNDSAGYLAAAGVALLGFGTARAATPLELPSLRAVATVLWLTAVVTVAAAADWPPERLAVVTALVGALSTFAYLGLWAMGRAENWNRPLNTLAVIGNVLAGFLALSAWPDRGLTVAIALSLAAQAIAAGVYRDKPAILAFAPPLTASAFFVALGEGFASHPLWYTLPLGMVVLSELEILRQVRRRAGQRVDTSGTVTVEVLGLGLLVMPPLVSMFGGGLAFAGLALTVAIVCMVWAGVTRVRRRVIAAGAIAIATTVLTVVAAAAGSAPENVAFWVTGAGIGVAVMMVAGLIEAYRSKKGQLMTRLDQLLEGWD